MGFRQEAIEKGEKFYLSGKPCPKGHTNYRYTSTGTCVTCMRQIARSEKRREYDRGYYQKNRESILKASNEYYYANRERYIETAREWVRRNKEKSRAIKKAHKHRRRSIEGAGLSNKELKEWEGRQIKVCYWCGVKCKRKYHIDHYEPLSKGGKHEENNLVIACAKCNMTKSNKDPYQYANQIGRLF